MKKLMLLTAVSALGLGANAASFKAGGSHSMEVVASLTVEAAPAVGLTLLSPTGLDKIKVAAGQKIYEAIVKSPGGGQAGDSYHLEADASKITAAKFQTDILDSNFDFKTTAANTKVKLDVWKSGVGGGGYQDPAKKTGLSVDFNPAMLMAKFTAADNLDGKKMVMEFDTDYAVSGSTAGVYMLDKSKNKVMVALEKSGSNSKKVYMTIDMLAAYHALAGNSKGASTVATATEFSPYTAGQADKTIVEKYKMDLIGLGHKTRQQTYHNTIAFVPTTLTAKTGSGAGTYDGDLSITFTIE